MDTAEDVVFLLDLAAKYSADHPQHRNRVSAIATSLGRSDPYEVLAYRYIDREKRGLTHEERRERRREIVHFHLNNPQASKQLISQIFNVSVATVTLSIKSVSGTIGPLEVSNQQCFWWYRCRKLSDKSLDIIYRLIDGTSAQTLSKEYGISRARVHQLRKAAECSGAVMPKTKRADYTRQCEICGSPFVGKKRACSPQCRLDLIKAVRIARSVERNKKWSRVVKTKHTCARCGDEYERSNYQISIAQKTNMTRMGKPNYRPRSNNASTTPKYCSSRCYYSRNKPVANHANQPFVGSN